MLRFFLAILLTFSAATVVVYGVLVYHISPTITLIAEEESSKDTPVVEEGKDITQENSSFFPDLYRYPVVGNRQMGSINKSCFYSKGFGSRPYNPPESA